MKIRRKPQSSPESNPVARDDDGTFRILVCGSRDWVNIAPIRKHLLKLIVDQGYNTRFADVLVIHGGSRGADLLAEELCLKELGIAVARFPAAWRYWQTLGKGPVAGPVRNFWMLKWGQPHYILAFHPHLPASKGTKRMLKLARENGFTKIRVVKE